MTCVPRPDIAFLPMPGMRGVLRVVHRAPWAALVIVHGCRHVLHGERRRDSVEGQREREHAMQKESGHG